MAQKQLILTESHYRLKSLYETEGEAALQEIRKQKSNVKKRPTGFSISA